MTKKIIHGTSRAKGGRRTRNNMINASRRVEVKQVEREMQEYIRKRALYERYRIVDSQKSGYFLRRKRIEITERYTLGVRPLTTSEREYQKYGHSAVKYYRRNNKN